MKWWAATGMLFMPAGPGEKEHKQHPPLRRWHYRIGGMHLWRELETFLFEPRIPRTCLPREKGK